VNPSLLKSLSRVTAEVVAGVTALDRAEYALDPITFVARTWNLYGVPFVRPLTVRLVAPATTGRRAPTGDSVAALITRTVYPVTGDPPSLAGGAQLTVAHAFPGVADTAVGTPGTARGVTATEAVEAAEVPAALVAVTVNVYA
jgi:hypothetical protein